MSMMGYCLLPQTGVAAPTPATITGAPTSDDMIPCRRCGRGCCDVRIVSCGCSFHARCISLSSPPPMTNCPHCNSAATGIVLFPMNFREIDEARRASALMNNNGVNERGRKRKKPSSALGRSDQEGSSLDQERFNDSSDRRTGRWTTEEMTYCDKLIAKFKDGQLPVVDGVKLNDFLANMLKSKQSRLTKKMKNASLSSKSFKCMTGYIADVNEAREFSDLEISFYNSIQSQLERAEIKFHVQKEWRELFSSYCVSVGQPLDADAWLSSVEEMDRRAAAAKDAARTARRKLMMGFALTQDAQNPDSGVFIERSNDAVDSVSNQFSATNLTQSPVVNSTSGGASSSAVSTRSVHDGKNRQGKRAGASKNNYSQTSPFLAKVVAYIHRHGVPFEYIDAWVPSFVNTGASSDGNDGVVAGGDSKCRLCFAGCAIADLQVSSDGKGQGQAMTVEEQYNLLAFGDYSQKFSFNVGCGLPGRVYQSGVPTWEQSVQHAPHHHFERCGGAVQWGIKTVVGIPVPSPNVGRVVVTLYSRHDREKDQELVGKLCDEFTKLMPSPKWKLVVDVGRPTSLANDLEQISSSTDAVQDTSSPSESRPDNRMAELIALLGEQMPSDPSSPLAPFLQGVMSLRLTLLKSTRTEVEEEIASTLLSSYASYSSTGRSKSDIALMLARDYIFLKQQLTHQVQNTHQEQIQHNFQDFGAGNETPAPVAPVAVAVAPTQAVGHSTAQVNPLLHHTQHQTIAPSAMSILNGQGPIATLHTSMQHSASLQSLTSSHSHSSVDQAQQLQGGN